MRPIAPMSVPRPAGVRRGVRVLAATAAAATLALTATACGPSDDGASAAASSASASPAAADPKITIPDDLKDKLKQHGIDLDKWKHGEWKNWDRDQWLRQAQDFVNPIIQGLWNPDRMRKAEQPAEAPVQAHDISGDQGVTDPEPAPVQAREAATPYASSVPVEGKLFFDGPQGSMVCSATVVTDPAHPGKSDMVWTAGHCVHAGKSGGWYRNIAFVPSYNDKGLPTAQLKGAGEKDLAPYGVWWADWAETSSQWIAEGSETGGHGSPYDFAVLHVTPEKGGSGKSLQETVGAAMPVDFNAPAVPDITTITANGYPAAPPYDGQKLYQCAGRPGRLSLTASEPTEYRVGCSMTGGASGGGWFATGDDGKPALVSNTSIGPVTAGWLAGPHLGKDAQGIYDGVSKKFASQ
ncbi:trypsin-like serine peptidase [Streptomyces sp. NBC_01497]|uniref:trypsin-like serine peptidase n=1 Tax=Streptomyces sp. NBC_01497 TaxID=2903885 RepID=UPI003FCDBB30